MQISGLVAVGFYRNLWVIWAGSVILGVGTGLITTVSYTVLGTMEGEKGKISGFFYLFTGTGIALGPVFGGFLASLFGTKAAFAGFIPLETAMIVYLTACLVLEKDRGKNPFSRVISSK